MEWMKLLLLMMVLLMNSPLDLLYVYDYAGSRRLVEARETHRKGTLKIR